MKLKDLLNEGYATNEVTKILDGLNRLHDIYQKQFGPQSQEMIEFSKIKNDFIYKQLNPMLKKHKVK